MPKPLVEDENLLFVYKPPGIATHRPSDDHQGFVEWWQLQKPETKLYVCHRLDKETSGVLVFAKNKDSAQTLTEIFTNHKVRKEYLFVSDKKSKFENWCVVEKQNQVPLIREGQWKQGGEEFESLTEFTCIHSKNSLYLYKAWPLSGKTHQIRKHAVKSQIPILGDTLYGGGAFPRLMLHAQNLEMEFDGNLLKVEAPPSRLFNDLSLLNDSQWCRWLLAFERREQLFPEKIHTDESLRLFHQETGDLRGDQVGKKLVLGWWKKEPPTEAEKQKIKNLCLELNYKNWLFEWRPGVQAKENTEVLIKNGFDKAQDSWTFLENKRIHKAHLQRGQNFGLFLDQRERRDWVQSNSKGKRVLNLFAFTCGFSLAAAIGGAKGVVSVDLSKKYLDWGKENFILNHIEPDKKDYQWVVMDTLEYLKWSEKKGLQFDIIVCDPPSFSRHKKTKKIFKVDRDFPTLIAACLGRLTPKGTLLFSSNYEKWTLELWQEKMSKEPFSVNGIQTSFSQWDYEWQKSEAGLKAFFLKKA